jgi:rod shape-determining protein MreC
MPAYTTENSDEGSRRQFGATIVFLLLAVSLHYLPPPAQESLASAMRSTVLRPFVLVQQSLARLRSQATESERLRERLDSVVAVAASRTDLLEENFRLRGLLSLATRTGPGYRAATVIRPGTAGSESMFLVDIGAEDGVRAPAAAITRGGLLGMVSEVRDETAIGLDWTHPDFRASAMTLDGTTTGIVESHRGDFREEDRLVLNGTAFHTTLEDGTVVVTSGLGGVYPRGIPIGRVRGLAEAEAGWRKSYWLEPFVQPGAARHVLVAVRGGADGAPAEDLSSAWPGDSILTTEELERVYEARRDSLAAVGDSLRMLKTLLEERRRADSIGAAVAPGSGG